MRNHSHLLCLALSFFTLCACSPTQGKEYGLHYQAKLSKRSDYAELSISIDNASLVKSLRLNIEGSQCSDFSGGDIEVSDGFVFWQPSTESSSLTYRCAINHVRPSSKQTAYDAIKTEQGAIFRGDDLFPSAKVVSVRGSEAKATLRFVLPETWSVHSAWRRDEKDKALFYIDNPERRFDRPTGWFITGELGTRKSLFEYKDRSAELLVSAFEGSGFRRMDTLAMMHFIWPELTQAFNTQPEKLLVVGAANPMWRGGLSASNSLYLHVERPLISENGTSTIIHELVHVFTGLHAEDMDDWIVEGLAEYYSVELLYRAGGMDIKRRERTFNNLAAWSKSISKLRAPSSKGKRTAKAALLFAELDREIQNKSDNKLSLDALVRAAMQHKKISLLKLRQEFEGLVGEPSKTLQQPLLN